MTPKTDCTDAVRVPKLAIRRIAGVAVLVLAAFTALSACSSDPATASLVPVLSEPTFDPASHTLIMYDDMNAYASATAMGATPQGSLPRIAPNPSPVTLSQPVNTSKNEVISPGRDGSGNALRMLYSGQSQNAATFVTVNSSVQPNNATHYFQYYARVTFLAPFTNTLAVKWFEAWHFGADRVQWNTHDHLPCPANSHKRTYWQVYDQGRATSCQGNQPIGPYFEDIANGQWHRFTMSYRPNSSSGARDGFARMWIDGVKVIDVSASTIDVVPPGGEKPWCSADDVDALANNDGIRQIWWGTTQTTVTPAWNYDIDDFRWWTKVGGT